jgi:hypothetical protein
MSPIRARRWKCRIAVDRPARAPCYYGLWNSLLRRDDTLLVPDIFAVILSRELSKMWLRCSVSWLQVPSPSRQKRHFP